MKIYKKKIEFRLKSTQNPQKMKTSREIHIKSKFEINIICKNNKDLKIKWILVNHQLSSKYLA